MTQPVPVPWHRRPTQFVLTLWQMVREGALPLAGLFVAALLGLFVLLAEEMIEGDTHVWDEAILLSLRVAGDTRDPIGPVWLHEAARDITALGSFAVLWLITAAVVLFLIVLRERASALLLLVSTLGGALLSTLLKMGFDRPRPDLVPHEAVTFTASFPSGHAMMSAVTYLTLGALLARIQQRRRERLLVIGIAIVLTLLVGASRVYLGVHWPSDVIAGWSIGAAWALICWMALAYVQQDRTKAA